VGLEFLEIIAISEVRVFKRQPLLRGSSAAWPRNVDVAGLGMFDKSHVHSPTENTRCRALIPEPPRSGLSKRTPRKWPALPAFATHSARRSYARLSCTSADGACCHSGATPSPWPARACWPPVKRHRRVRRLPPPRPSRRRPSRPSPQPHRSRQLPWHPWRSRRRRRPRPLPPRRRRRQPRRWRRHLRPGQPRQVWQASRCTRWTRFTRVAARTRALGN